MPQLFKNAVITNKGLQLLNMAQAGKIKIEFTRIVTGSGVYTEEEKKIEALQEREILKEQKNSYGLSDIDVYSEHSVKVTALITNQDPVTMQTLVSEGYYINEMGLYAKPYDSSENTADILYSITVTAGENGDYMPAYNENNPAQIIQDYFAAVSNASEVTIKTCNGAVALAEDLQKKLDKDGDGSNVTAVFEQADAGENIVSGEKMSVILGKVKKWFSDLKTVAFTNKYSDLDGKPSIPSLINNLLATVAGVGALDAYQGKVLKGLYDTLNTKVTDLTSGLSATQIIKTGSKSIALSATETWYRLGYLENGNKIFGEFLVCSSWDYNIPDICKFIVGGANNATVSYDIIKQFYSHRGVGLTESSMIKRIKKIRVCYYPNGLERNIYIDVCLKAGPSTNPDTWSYELSMNRNGLAGSPSRWVNSNFEANPAIPSGYAVKELDLADINVSDFILYRTFTKDNFDIGANTYGTASISYTVPNGYKMLCVVEVNIDNATSSGINKSSCNTYDTKWNDSTITAGIRNRGTNAAKLKLEARVQFIRDLVIG